MDDVHTIADLRKAAKGCRACPLSKKRHTIVFDDGEGYTNEHAPLMIVGEGPGQDDDLSGFPFVGRSGGLLDEALQAANIQRGAAYVTNVVKCRPPDNRTPTPEEREACGKYLGRQIDLVKPVVILTLGLLATRTFLGSGVCRIMQVRGKIFRHALGFYVCPTYHPSCVLRCMSEGKEGVRDLFFLDIRRLAWRLRRYT